MTEKLITQEDLDRFRDDLEKTCKLRHEPLEEMRKDFKKFYITMNLYLISIIGVLIYEFFIKH